MKSPLGDNAIASGVLSFDGTHGSFRRNFAVSVLLLLGLLALGRFPSFMGHSVNRLRMEKVIGQMRNGDLNRQDFDALAAGYYEGLRKDAPRAGMPIERDDVRFRDDFLRYEFKPNVRRSYPAGMRITNSLGMPNPEYGYQKPPNTCRIALLGDSLSVGPFGHDYVALLENRLNRDHGPERFEILNFSVYGYNIFQMMYVALEVAPKFHPDVYLVALTTLDGNSKTTALHIARLRLEGMDLKYDFLRQTAGKAGLEPTDGLHVMIRKLTPFHFQMTRWALEQIREHAATEGTKMVILLVPSPAPAAVTAASFDDILPTVEGLGVPVIDLRDTFKDVKDLSNLYVEYPADVHPNQRGHEMIFETLYLKLQQDPSFSASLFGASRNQKESVAESR